MQLGIEAGSDTITLAKELGIRGVPVDGGALLREGVEATLKPVRENGLQVCQIGAFGFNPISDDHAAAQRAGAALQQMIELASQTGCRHIVIGPGNYHPSGFAHYDIRNYKAESITAMATSIEPYIRLAEDHDVRLCIEPYVKGVVHSPEQFLKLQEAIGSPALRCNIDPSSLYDFHGALHSDAVIHDLCSKLKDHIGLVHIKEIGVQEGFHLHMGLAPLSEGNTNWPLLLELIAPYIPSDSWIILEHVLSKQQAHDDYTILLQAAAQANVTLN